MTNTLICTECLPVKIYLARREKRLQVTRVEKSYIKNGIHVKTEIDLKIYETGFKND